MSRRTEWTIIAVMIAAMLVAGFISLNSILSPAPRLDLAPAEENRIVHPLGFSLVCPENYEAEIGTSERFGLDQIIMRPAWGRDRYTPIIFARQLSEPPEGLAAMPRERFRGHQIPVRTGPSGKYEHWVALLNRGGEWYEVGVAIPQGARGDEPMPTAGWRRYLETFKVEARKNDDIGSSTRPTTEPSR